MIGEREIGRSIELAERLQSIVDGPALRAASDLAAVSALTLPAPSSTAIEQLIASQRRMTANLQTVSAQLIANHLRWTAGAQRIAEQIASSQYGISSAVEALNTAWPAAQPQPRRRPYMPEPERPPRAIEAVQVDSQITLEGLSHALAEGRLPVRDVMRLCLQHVPASKPGPAEPTIQEQIELVEGWHRAKGKVLQQFYCDGMGISVRSLQRYIRNLKALGIVSHLDA